MANFSKKPSPFTDFCLNSFFSLLLFGCCLFFRKPNFDNFSNFFKNSANLSPFAEKEEAQSIYSQPFLSNFLSVFERYDTDFKDLAYFCKENVCQFCVKTAFCSNTLKRLEKFKPFPFSVANFLRKMGQFFAKIPRKP